MATKWYASIAVVVVSLGVSLVATSVRADAVEYFECTLADNATMDQLVAAARSMLKDAKTNGFGDYRLFFTNPLYSDDTSIGTFFWVGVSPNAMRLGAYNDYWKAEGNKSHRERFGGLIKECESAGVHWSLEVTASE